MGTLFDGLGGEEVVNFSGTGLETLHIFSTGSITAGNQISGLNVFAAGSAQAPVTLFTTASGTNLFGAGSITVPKGIFTNGSIVGSLFTGVITNVTTSGTNFFGAGSATVPIGIFTNGSIAGSVFTGVITSVTSSGTNFFAAGSMTAPMGIFAVNGSATGSVFGGTFSTSNNVHLSVGSPYGKGVVVQLTARSDISGGMWVTCSGGLALAGPASAQAPVGVAQPGVNVASGGTVNVITHGIVPMIAEGTIALGAGASPGAGAALNCVITAGAGSGVAYPVLDTAGSEGTVFVFIK